MMKEYEIIETDKGIGLKSPWHTLMFPHEGDMWNPKEKARDALLEALLNGGGYCPCQPKKDRDTMCPCRNYRVDKKCICGLYVKSPQVVRENVKDKVVRDDTKTKDGEKQ